MFIYFKKTLFCKIFYLLLKHLYSSFLFLENSFFNYIQEIPLELPPNNYSFNCISTSSHVKTHWTITILNDITIGIEFFAIVPRISPWRGGVSPTIYRNTLPTNILGDNRYREIHVQIYWHTFTLSHTYMHIYKGMYKPTKSTIRKI